MLGGGAVRALRVTRVTVGPQLVFRVSDQSGLLFSLPTAGKSLRTVTEGKWNGIRSFSESAARNGTQRILNECTLSAGDSNSKD